jgi:hypothetical protein
MNVKTGMVLAIAGLMVAAPLSAQRGPHARRGLERERAPGVEQMLQIRDQLELSSEQIAQLNTLREELLTERVRAFEARERTRSDFMAGELTLSDMRSALEEQREARQAGAEATRERVEGILTEAQLEEFRSARQQARRNRGERGARGPGNGWRGRRGGRLDNGQGGLRNPSNRLPDTGGAGTD